MDPRDCINIVLRNDTYFCINCSKGIGRQCGELVEMFIHNVDNPINRFVRARILCDSFACIEPTCTRHRLSKTITNIEFVKTNGMIKNNELILRPNVLTVGVNRDVPTCKQLLTHNRAEWILSCK